MSVTTTSLRCASGTALFLSPDKHVEGPTKHLIIAGSQKLAFFQEGVINRGLNMQFPGTLWDFCLFIYLHIMSEMKNKKDITWDFKEQALFALHDSNKVYTLLCFVVVFLIRCFLPIYRFFFILGLCHRSP